MKRILIFLVFIQISLVHYGQIIADHTVVDKYDKIPQLYIDKVKKMLVNVAGISHSTGYRIGADLLELIDSKYLVLTYDSDPPPVFSDQYLRIGRHGTIGEYEFYISPAFIDVHKSKLTTQYLAGNPYSVFGLGWCYTMTWVNAPGGTIDPVYNVRWAGSSDRGPDGDIRWGLDNGDQILTGNSINMNTYLSAVEQYIQHCTTNNYPTKIIFTTGPVDGNAGSENGFQREIKHDYIRNYVSTNNSRILFDYADILCWNNNGVKYVTNWNDGGTLRPHANIHPDNLMDYDASWNIIPFTEDGDHIGEVGALRVAKAMWWMLARIAGWDGVSTSTGVPEIVKTSESKVALDMGDNLIRINSSDKYVNGQVGLYDLNGHLIESKSINDNINYISTSLLSSGLYLIVLSKDNSREVKKIVLLR